MYPVNTGGRTGEKNNQKRKKMTGKGDYQEKILAVRGAASAIIGERVVVPGRKKT